jgi:hypothetical protein
MRQIKTGVQLADSWVKKWSTEHERDYYHNTKTGGSTWTVPEDFVEEEPPRPKKAKKKPKVGGKMSHRNGRRSHPHAN